jgi:methylated-DNA-[protein]-cysteine S-methyltransferase
MPVATPRRMSAVIDSPVGRLMLVAADGALTGLYLEDREPTEPDGLPRAGSADRESSRPAGTGSIDEANAQVLAEATRQLDEYFAGQRRGFDLPLALEGTAFQRRVWDALRDIPYGETTSYGRLASEIGQPTAARAVGLANGRNPVSIIVPCHRVVGADGSLTGYGGGLDRKQRLLDLERRASHGTPG